MPFALQGWRRWVSLLAAPLAALLLLAVYVQALFMPLHLRRIRWRASWDAISCRSVKSPRVIVRSHLADAVLTTDYETTAWLRFTSRA